MIEREYDYSHKLLGDGWIRFQFNDKGLLCGFELSADIDETLTAKLIARMPVTLADLEYWKTRKHGKLNEHKMPVDFDMFYNRYGMLGGDKRNRSRCEKVWARLSTIDQRRAYRYMSSFFAKIKPGLNIMHPDRYLREKVWND